jgi:threonine 3-dehydrogenase
MRFQCDNFLMSKPATLIVGAAGAVGKRLCAALTARGHRVIASDRMDKLPGSLQRAMGDLGTCVGGVDVCDVETLRTLFEEHADENTTVWNLAAPLSVETALDPAVAEAVTMGGMRNVLQAMAHVGARRICFTDSIGSFGAAAPRRGATARWLHENPNQDPGSDYGLQKRGCRELMATFAEEHGGDPRFAVLPGVLHSEAVWGNGTTEYALDALLAAPHQQTTLGLPAQDAYLCPIDPDVRMPMVFVDDLMNGLIALQEADEQLLTEPEQGYCLPGLSFTPNELFVEIRKHYPGFGFRVELDDNMNKFANLWPDELSEEEPLRDLGYSPNVTLADMVSNVLGAHENRNMLTANAFKEMDTDHTGELTRVEMEKHVRKYLVRGREEYSRTGQGAVSKFVDKLMNELDTNKDGIVSWGTFSEWSRRHSMEEELWRQAATVEDQLRKQIRELGHEPVV